MGKKEKLQKELDLLLEKIRFWRYVIFAIVSGVIGVLFGLTQQKVNLNWGVISLLTLGLLGLIISTIRLNELTKVYQSDLELLEKEE